MSATKPAINWQDIDTVLLDIDGTLLDLHYDNFVWDQVVPEAYAQLEQLPYAEAKEQLFAQMHQVLGSIEFYSLTSGNNRRGSISPTCIGNTRASLASVLTRKRSLIGSGRASFAQS